MKRIFSIQGGFEVPDGTFVYPFLNPYDSTSGLPWGLLEGCSIAAGDISPGRPSRIQVLPLATQITFVLRGALDIKLKEAGSPEPYIVHLAAEQAAVQCRGTFFQLINPGDTLCRVLYIVSPPYVFDQQDGEIRYDDALVFDDDWDTLAGQQWLPPALRNPAVTPQARQAALERLARKSGHA